jgi:hypothetical protein
MWAYLLSMTKAPLDTDVLILCCTLVIRQQHFIIEMKRGAFQLVVVSKVSGTLVATEVRLVFSQASSFLKVHGLRIVSNHVPYN